MIVHESTARADIYTNGKRVIDRSTNSGYRIDRSRPQDKNDAVLIKKGEKYFYYTPFGKDKVISKEMPKLKTYKVAFVKEFKVYNPKPKKVHDSYKEAYGFMFDTMSEDEAITIGLIFSDEGTAITFNRKTAVSKSLINNQQ